MRAEQFSLYAESSPAQSGQEIADKLSDATIQLGERIREMRAERDWSREHLADLTDLHWTYVGQVERGERNLSLRNILRLAEALDTDPRTLVRGLPSW